MKKILLSAIVFLLIIPELQASHLAGGTIEVICVSGNQFRFRLVKYRDPGGAPLAPGPLVVVEPMNGGSAQSFGTTQISFIPSLPIPSTNPCLIPPPNSSLEERVYETGIVTLTGGTGYYLYHRDAARNGLVNMGGGGMALYAEMPDPSAYGCNNSPIFDQNPPMAVCLNQPMNYQGSATDPEGDVLNYRLCNALTYGGGNNTPPFPIAPYIGGWTGANPVSSSPQLAIDPTTGVVTGTPNQLGSWVFNYCVDEFRSGVKIGQYNREVQMTVSNCNQPITAGIGTQYTSINLGVPVIDVGEDSTITFTNTSNTTTADWFWDFGVPWLTNDTSNAFEPTYTYPDTGTYIVTLILNKGYPCADTVYSTVLVYPTVTADFEFSTQRCAGIPINFTDLSQATFGTINYWNWQFGNGGSSVGQNPFINQDPVYTYVSQGNYNVRLVVESSKGVRDTINKLVQVGSTPVVNAGPQKTICQGVSTTLQGSGSPGSTFSWSPSTGLSCVNCPQPSLTRNTPGVYVYTLTATNPTGCSNQATVIVVVTGAPTVSAGPDKYLCGGASGVSLAGSVLNSTTGYTVSWSPSGSLNLPSVLNPTASPSSTTSYTLTVTTTSGCVLRDTVTVFPNSINADAGPAQTICPGSNAQLNGTSAVPGVSYSWAPGGSLSDPSIQNPVATPASKTTYTVTVNDPVSGCTGTDTVRVTIKNPPPVNAGPDTTICINSSATLQASGANAYVWDQDPSLSCINCPNPTASTSSTTTYYVTGSDALGCTNRDSVVVTVAPLPNASIAQAPTVSICPQESVQLNASGGVSYSWSPSNSLSCASCTNPVATPGNNTVYTVTVADINNCTNTAMVQVDISTPPIVNVSPDLSICAGDTTQLNVTGGSSYNWLPASSLDNPNIANPKAFPLSSTVYTVTATDGNGCTTIDSVAVTVNQLANGSFITDTAICNGGNVQLFANGFSQYTWSPANSLSCANCPTPVASPTVTTTYTVDVTDLNGCTDNGTVQVSVNPLPSITVTNSTDICTGDSIVLSASGGVSYDWAPAGSLDDPNSSNPIASPLNTTTYTVTVTDAKGCVNTATTTISVRPLPTVVTSADLSICKGETAQITANGGVSYAWSPGGTLSCINCPDPIASPALTTEYTVEVTDQFGCENFGNVEVTVNVLQPGNFIPDTSICAGNSIQLYANGFTQYAWSPAYTLSCTNCPNPVANPTITTTYNVSVVDPNGCKDTGQVTLTVNALPPVSAGSDVAICDGQSTNLNAAGALTYSWSPGTGLSNPGVSNPTATPSNTITYTVTGTDANGCVDTDDVEVEVNPLPQTNAGQDVSICLGEDAPLQATGANSYTWSPGSGLSCTSCPDPVASPATTTTYTVSGMLPTGCTQTDEITVTVNALPNVGVTPVNNSICIGDNVQLTATGGTSYQWSPAAGLSCTNCPNPVATPTNTTTYTVAGFNASGCSAEATSTINVATPALVDITPDTAICPGQTLMLSATGGATYNWTPGNQSTSSITITPAQNTTYTVDIVDANGCDIQGTVEVTINTPANPQVSGDATICFGDTASLSASNGVTYNWAPTAGVLDPTSGTTGVSPVMTTIYTVTIVDNNGCTNSDEVEITIIQSPTVDAGPDLSIYEGDRAVLQATGAATYLWSPPLGINDPTSDRSIIYPADTITYYVVGTDNFGCTNTDSVTVFVLPRPTYYVPTGFSPNGDGNNDKFEVYHATNFNLVSMRIYDRWGTLIYQTDDISRGWDGMGPNGEPMPIGSYVFVIEAVDDIGFPITRTGNITLIR